MNSVLANKILSFLCPTIHYTQSAVAKFPVLDIEKDCLQTSENVSLSKRDWDSYETSWDFKRNPLV